MIRNSMRFVGWAQRRNVCAELRAVYSAPTEQAGLAELATFEAKHAQSYPAIASSWRSNWERVRPFFDFPAELRRLIYTTNAIESLNFQLRKVTKAKGHFPSDEAATKLLYLALRNAERKWTMVPRFWTVAALHRKPLDLNEPGWRDRQSPKAVTPAQEMILNSFEERRSCFTNCFA